jgi:hypothetical protein
VDYQKKADGVAWEWDAAKAGAAYSLRQHDGPYRVEVLPKPGPRGEVVIRFVEDGRQVYALEAHTATVFVVKGPVLYHADFHPRATGCALVAYDLRQGKQLWRTTLHGMGQIAHSKYYNAVTLDLDGDALCVRGKESAGNYVEYVHRKTGRTVGHKVFRNR